MYHFHWVWQSQFVDSCVLLFLTKILGDLVFVIRLARVTDTVPLMRPKRPRSNLMQTLLSVRYTTNPFPITRVEKQRI